jgi:hypothetical protein
MGKESDRSWPDAKSGATGLVGNFRYGNRSQKSTVRLKVPFAKNYGFITVSQKVRFAKTNRNITVKSRYGLTRRSR